MNKVTQFTKIPLRTRNRVYDRDGRCCILCGRPWYLEMAHIVPRSALGMGVAQNLVTLCRQCHFDYDNGGKREEYGQLIRDYIKGWYPNWTEEMVTYRKGMEYEAERNTED